MPPATSPEADGTNFDWGVLAETTPCYASSGTATGRLLGGTVIEKISVHTSSRGPMLRCRLLEGSTWRSDVFVPESAVVVFAGPYAEGSYEVTLPVTRAAKDAVKPEFAAAFTARHLEEEEA